MRIGELAALVGVSTRTVRHYHHLGLLPEPVRLTNGYREYRLRDAVALARVRRLAEVGLSLDEIRDVLADDQNRELREVLLELDADLAGQQEAIGARRNRLAVLLAETDLHPDSTVSPDMAAVLRDLPAEGSKSAEIDRELLALMDTVADPADRAQMLDLMRPLTEPDALARAHAFYGRLDELADADPGDGREATFDRLVPVQVRKVMEFELKGVVSLLLWMGRRRNGVPPGATTVPYSKEQTPLLLVILFSMIVETVAVDLLLIALDVPDGLRVLVLVLDLYGIVFGLALGAACVTRPHVVAPGELRLRYGAYFDLRVPRELIASVRLSRNYNESDMVTVADGRLGVAVSSQTNVIVELTEPITVIRPLGRHAEATTIRFFADTPGAALNALRPLQPRGAR